VPVEAPHLPATGRRAVDQVLSDEFLILLSEMADKDLADVQQRLAEAEAEISRLRRAVFDASDVLQAELVRPLPSRPAGERRPAAGLSGAAGGGALGLVESRHLVSVAAVDGGGSVVFRSGEEQGTPFFLRSAAKPFQAAASQRCGAGLVPEQLAVAAASHTAQPVHVALVADMLASAGLEPEHLLCPPPGRRAREPCGAWARPA